MRFQGDTKRHGLCASGQTLRAATRYLLQPGTVVRKKNLIINLGTIDILKGSQVIDLKFDYDRLLDACLSKGIEPIITTLTPLIFEGTTAEQHDVLMEFNQFLRDRYNKEYTVIDLWAQMLDFNGEISNVLYQK